MTIRTPNIRMRGIRQKMPSGYMLGRINPGDGEAELIKTKDFGQHLVETGTVAGGSAVGSSTNPAYEFLGFQATGPFVANQRFNLAMAPRAVLFPSVHGAANSHVSCGFAPAATYVFHLVTDYAAFLASGAGVVATFTFTAGQKTGTISWGTPVTIAQWAVLYMVMSATPDATLSDVQVLVAGDAE